MSNVIVIAPHPDDETLGCGGTILKHIKNKDKVFWLIVTKMSENKGWLKKSIDQRKKEIKLVDLSYKFTSTYQLELDTGWLDQIPLHLLIDKIGQIIKTNKIEIVYTPFIGDAHSDHNIVTKAAIACCKWFRYPYVKEVLMYETISETNLNILNEPKFKPNVYIDISDHLQKKIKIMRLYKSEVKKHPFPRSDQAIKSLAIIRGSESGFIYAESFQQILRRIK
tara:strand:- start:5472 stop:6140 length:669 start_codon:yes stop_codon:yes gene_type:complete